MNRSQLTSLVLPLAISLILLGCSSGGVQNPKGIPVTQMNADERGFVAGTGVESQDLVAVTDKMSRSILGVRQIAAAATTPKVVLEPVINESRFPINKDIFLTRIRTQLNSKSQGKVSFLAREYMAALEQACVMQDIAPFASLLSSLVKLPSWGWHRRFET